MTAQKNYNEVLYDNLLDKEIKALFMPFHILQTFFMLPKYKIYNNFIIFNSFKVDLLSAFSFLIPITCYIVRFIYFFPIIKTRYTYFAATTSWDLFFYSSGHIIGYILTIIHKQTNVELVLNIQRVIKMFKFKQCNFAKFNITSWIIVSFTIIYFIVLQFFYIFGCERSVLHALPDVFVIHFVISAIYCIRVINMITIQLRLWIGELKHLQAVTHSSIIKNEIFSKYNETHETLPRLKDTGQRQYSMKQEWKRLFNMYRKIMKSYAIFNKLFQLLILHCGIASFVTSMINVQFWIELEGLKWNSYKKNIYKLSISMLAVKDIFINCAISFACQKFYTVLRKAEIACIETLNSTDEPAARITCKNVLRYNAIAFHKIQACRLYEVDATLPLRLMMSTVSYAVVLIQLAFIK